MKKSKSLNSEQLPYVPNVDNEAYKGNPIMYVDCPECKRRIVIPQAPQKNVCPFCRFQFLLEQDGDALLFYTITELRMIRWNDDVIYIS